MRTRGLLFLYPPANMNKGMMLGSAGNRLFKATSLGLAPGQESLTRGETRLFSVPSTLKWALLFIARLWDDGCPLKDPEAAKLAS